MEFEEKPEIKELVQDEKLDHAIIESELAPALQSQFQEEPALGPVPQQEPELHSKAPDPSALAAWVDDLSDYGNAHLGDVKATELLDRIASGSLDDISGTARAHLKEDVSAEMEQQGMVNDFHADSAIEGGALDTHGAQGQGEGEKDEDLPLSAQRAAGHGDDDGDGGGGGGGGSGGGLPGDGGAGDGDGDGDGDADDTSDPKNPKKKKKGEQAEKTENKPDKPKPDKPGKPEPTDKTKRDDKKRDGDR